MAYQCINMTLLPRWLYELKTDSPGRYNLLFEWKPVRENFSDLYH